ncbi:MAG: NADH-quinone oxidoreductase subunit J [Candidatus Cyclobacteriaceae bacterium M3_2C_046]
MTIAFYIAASIAVLSTFMVITRTNAVHALLYLIVSLLSVSVIFYLAGAPFVAALEVIIYAGAIMVLFIFVIMMLNLGKGSEQQEKAWLRPVIWIGPAILSLVLFLEVLLVFLNVDLQLGEMAFVGPKQVGISLFTNYLLAVELAGMLLMAGIIGAYHLGKRKKKIVHRYLEKAS